MRPVGEVRLALLTAARELSDGDTRPTLREIAVKACVGTVAAKETVKNMTRAGELRVLPRRRKVEYRNRPVAEYELASETEGFVDLGELMSAWTR
jgi:hypothetical protein